MLYTALFRAANGLCQRIAQLFVCQQPANTAGGDDGDGQVVIRSVNMHGLQIEAAGRILVHDEHSHHQSEVLRLFEAYGSANTNSYTAFSNPEIQVFLAPGVGCLLYTVARHWCRTVVCATGDPLCEPHDTLRMLKLFNAAFPGAISIDLSKRTAQLLAADGGVTITDLGPETVIHVQEYDFDFNKKTKHIRRRAEVAAKAGLVVEEVTQDSSTQLKQEVRQMALEWQQGKACTDDIKVFSRALPWGHIGAERGVRVLIARTLAPGEVPSRPAPLTAEVLGSKGPAQQQKQQQQQQQQQASPAAEQPQEPAGHLSRKQRKLRERAARARALQEAAASGKAAASQDAAADGALDSRQQQDEAARDAIVIIMDQEHTQQQQQQQQSSKEQSFQAGQRPAAAIYAVANKPQAAGGVVLELPSFSAHSKGHSSHPSRAQSAGSNSSVRCSGPSESTLGSAGSTYDVTAAPAVAGGPEAAGPRIHACIILDPVYNGSQVVGYTAERSFLHPQGVKGAVKLLLRETLGLLRAEGLSLLNLGLAVGFEVKPGAYHGFRDCTWLTRSLQLCYKYGNSLYAFHNLAHTKACWGGGYTGESDTYKFSKAVELRRKFAAVPSSWSCPLGDGPFNAGVCFRHFGLYGDPWELLMFWRFVSSKRRQPLAAPDSE